MRFFKYLLLIFLSTLSVNAFAELVYRYGTNMTEYTSRDEACNAWRKAGGLSLGPKNEDSSNAPTGGYCVGYRNLGQPNAIRLTETWNAFDKPKECPKAGTPLVAWLEKGTTHIPIRLCKDGCTFTGNGSVVEMTNYDNTILQSTGNADNCTNQYKDDPPPKCDKTNPYGDCYVPPDDKCVRAKDGSIFCPDNSKPPENNTCNGADYCKRPPEGCGPGYVPGSFNGEQLCVRSGPNVPKNPPDPDKPDDPNNCMNGGTYCPQPPDNTQCPSGYTETTYNGSKICVKNNPDPDKPNPNDPNNPDYEGGGDGGGDNGGGDGSTGGGTIDVKGIIDAINALKAALLNAIAGISGKLDTLIAGQKTGNEHLKNIKDESVKTNEKLDKSNEHLGKIEDATSAASDTLGEINDAAHATSEAVGETNKKLDSIKDAIDSQSKCLDKNSGKYRECTPDDFSAASTPDGKVDILEREIDTNFDGNIISVSDQCPPPMVIRFNLLEEHVITFSYDNFCYGASLARPWVIFVGMLTAFLIVTGQIRGGSDD
jgi:hypothetical protein